MKDEKKKITDTIITNLLYKLTIISHIKQGDKLYCDSNSNIFVDNSYMPSLSRYFFNQNREITSKTLNELINDIIYVTDFVYRNEISIKKNEKEKNDRQLRTFFKESNDRILKNFYIKLTCCLDGLNNLKLTYNNDISMKTVLDLLIKKIESRIDKLENILIIAI
tara:strand:- start:227 stop:721 length:495 start_codon:yes stop_codon:yes gene_type:complete